MVMYSSRYSIRVYCTADGHAILKADSMHAQGFLCGVCVCVCVYVRIYVCMYVCMYVRMYVCK